MFLVVQEILTRWTKESRGGAAAARRNAVPEVLPFPLDGIAVSEGALVHHTVLFREDAGFDISAHRTETSASLTVLEVACVTITPDPERVRLEFRWRWDCGGAPERASERKNLSCGPGEWAQVVYNGRFQCRLGLRLGVP